MINGVWLSGINSFYAGSNPLDFYAWIIYYDGPGPFIGRANYHHTLAVF